MSVPRWYLWDGGFFLLGRSDGVVPAHEHHAMQVVFAVDGAVAIAGADGEWKSGGGMIVRPDVVHSYSARGAYGAMLFVDPESAEGLWLRSSLASDITVVPDARLEPCVRELRTFIERPMESMEVGALIRHCVRALCAGPAPVRKLDERVTLVLRAIRASRDLHISLDSAASMVFLSPSRFAHLFKAQVGLPFRRYMLWRKLTRAMLAIGREKSITEAAYGSDFSDGAHLTRTFQQMVGLAPSVLMKGEFFEVVAPWEG
jgi:AraC family transcriptional regulator